MRRGVDAFLLLYRRILLLCKQEPSFLATLLTFIRFNNPDKGAVSHAIVHRALWEYLTAVNATKDDAEREKHRREICETYVALSSLYSRFLISFKLPGNSSRDGSHKRWKPGSSRLPCIWLCKRQETDPEGFETSYRIHVCRRRGATSALHRSGRPGVRRDF